MRSNRPISGLIAQLMLLQRPRTGLDLQNPFRWARRTHFLPEFASNPAICRYLRSIQGMTRCLTRALGVNVRAPNRLLDSSLHSPDYEFARFEARDPSMMECLVQTAMDSFSNSK